VARKDVDKGRRERRILVVEDEPNMARLVEANLKRQGYESVEKVGNLSLAMAKVTDRPSDLIILDIVLHRTTAAHISRQVYEREVGTGPHQSTLAFHKWLRRRRPTARTHVLFHTARVFMEDLIPELNDSYTFYLHKTDNPLVLVAWVEKVFEKKIDGTIWDLTGPH